MPPLLMFGITSELKLQHLMSQMAGEAEHTAKVTEWANKKIDADSLQKQLTVYDKLSPEERERKLSELYMQSVGGSGVRIVPGNKLGIHHLVANFWQENPFKVLGGLGVPAVGYIFLQRHKQAHLDLQQQIMQTRVVGQFTVLIFLFSLMGFKEYMDSNGKFITELEAKRRVAEMREARKELQYRMNEDLESTNRTLDLVHKIHGDDATKGVKK